MGRPRRHDDRTAEALLDTAERIVEAEGADALTVRGVADAAGTTTRAVYSVFGSKEGLVTGLCVRAFEWLHAAIDAVPETDDPVDDLARAGVLVWRRFVVERPALFEIAFQRGRPAALSSASASLAALERRVARLDLGDRSVRDATRAFHALCEGLSVLELRCWFPPGEEERAWHDALTALLRGLTVR